MTKDQRTIKQLNQQLADMKVDLDNKVAELKRTEEYKKQYDNELRDIHATFDLLGIPRHVKNNYHDMSANARLTLFLAQTHGIKVEQPKDPE